MKYSIRDAAIADAPAACEVVRRSIAELCIENHRSDEATLAAWLGNKTVANFEAWINSDRHVALVAEGSAGVIGFGLLNREGAITLLYISPESRFQGVSKALLVALEEAARSTGIRKLTVGSTATARRFYLGSGYVPEGSPAQGFGLTTSYPMSKRVAP